MALNERADVLTSRDDAADDASTLDAQDPLELVADGNGAALDDDLEGTDGHDRIARKRTARQRTLLVTGNGTDATGGVTADPLIAVPEDDEDEAVAEELEDDAVDDDEDDDLDEAVPAFVTGDDRPEAHTVVDEPPADEITTAAVPIVAVGVAATTFAPVDPSPATMPLPATVLDGNGRTATDEPAPPVMVPPPPKPQRRTRPRVRKVTRVVRSVDAWSVFKVALIFFVAMGVVIVTAGVLLWNLAQSTGTLDNVEGFFREAFNYDTFKLDSGVLFHALLTLTALFVVAGTGLAVVMAVLFNLIADLTGGIRVTVLEREVIARDDVRLAKRKPRPPTSRARRAAPPPPPTPPPYTG
jgi:hypothetical protein